MAPNCGTCIGRPRQIRDQERIAPCIARLLLLQKTSEPILEYTSFHFTAGKADEFKPKTDTPQSGLDSGIAHLRACSGFSPNLYTYEIDQVLSTADLARLKVGACSGCGISVSLILFAPSRVLSQSIMLSVSERHVFVEARLLLLPVTTSPNTPDLRIHPGARLALSLNPSPLPGDTMECAAPLSFTELTELWTGAYSSTMLIPPSRSVSLPTGPG